MIFDASNRGSISSWVAALLPETKSSNVKRCKVNSPNEKSPKFKNFKRAKSGPDSQLQLWDIENIPLDTVVRFGMVRLE